MKLNKNQKYWAELEIQTNGKVKVKKARKYTHVNQFVNRWTPINARNLARAINKSSLVTR